MRHEQLSIGDLLLGTISKIVNGNGAKNGVTVKSDERGGVFHKTVLQCVATPIALADQADTAQYGGVKVYDFPAGNIAILGAQVKGSLVGYASLVDTFEGDVSLGTVTAAGDATLTATEANIMASNAITAADEVAPVDATGGGMAVLSGVAAPVACFLNVVVDDETAHGAGTATFTGEIVLLWANLSDK